VRLLIFDLERRHIGWRSGCARRCARWGELSTDGTRVMETAPLSVSKICAAALIRSVVPTDVAAAERQRDI
jgi:hypothetical protein